MFTKLAEPFVLLIVTLITLSLSYFKVSITVQQQIIAFLMVLIVLAFSKLPGIQQNNKLIPSFLINYIFLFIVTLFVQLLVVSTGGLFSSFLALFHLFTIATSFLINFYTALIFLLLSLLMLGINIVVNPTQLLLLKEDPGTGIILGLSFLIVVPIARLVADRYYIKDKLAKILKSQVRVGETIMENLSELVVVTNPDLKVLSVNDAFKQALGLTDQEILSKPLLQILTLKDFEGKEATPLSLSIDRVLIEKATHIISGLLLYTPKKSFPFKVVVQITPIESFEKGGIDQLSFVIKEGQHSGNQTHEDLERAIINQATGMEELQKQLQNTGYEKLSLKTLLLNKSREDTLVAEELEDHPIKTSSTLIDIAALAQEVVSQKKELSERLRIQMMFKLGSQDANELSLMNLQKSTNIPKESLPHSNFLATIDARWTKILLEKLLDIVILLCANQPNKQVEVSPFRNPSGIEVVISTKLASFPLNKQASLFNLYYPGFEEDFALSLGSGLEGFIAKSIATQLNIPISVNYYLENNQFSLKITAAKRA